MPATGHRPRPQDASTRRSPPAGRAPSLANYAVLAKHTLLARYAALARFAALAGALCAGLLACGAAAKATPALVMDVATGDVLYQQEATRPWFPASTTKLMTVYVALAAVRDHQIAMNTPLVVSARAHAMPPSKMGFAVGTQVTLDNALKMLMVRSANDLAVTVAEGVGGSVEGFADDMNAAAARLGLRESHFVNPNGLPASDHVSSARDMAILARALYTQFPDEAGLFDLGALSLGSQVIVNHNNLLGRYPGADGMKTGFTCAAGFNVVASAYRDGRRLVTVVFGAPNVATRTAKVAALFDRGFAGIDRPTASVVALPAAGTNQPADMHNQVCRARGGLVAQFNHEVEQLDQPLLAPAAASGNLLSQSQPRAPAFATQSVASTQPTATRINFMPRPVYTLTPVRVGADPGYTGPVAEARAAHTPVGSETPPVTAEAYAATPPVPPDGTIGETPLAVDANALPLKGRRRRADRHPRAAPKASAAAEAPTTKVIDGGDAAEEPGKTQEGKAHEGKAREVKGHEVKGHEVKGLAGKRVAAVKPAAGDGDEAKQAAIKEAAARKAAPARKPAAKASRKATGKSARAGGGDADEAKAEAPAKAPVKAPVKTEDE